MPNAWNLTTGSSSVNVGIVDSGISGNQPDLVNRINSSLIHDSTEDNSPLTDSVGHGTKVAGIIGSQGNNANGTCGVCWNIKLVSLKVSSSTTVHPDKIVDAIVYAKNNGIKLLNPSLGVAVNDMLESAIDDYNGLIVCAAGNNNQNLDGDVSIYPAHYRSRLQY